MQIKKKIHGVMVDIEILKIKEYKRFSLYQVYRVINRRYIPIYQECFTEFQIREIIANNYFINEGSV